ncbi:MAG: DUF3127 domain-containing protein [Paramuribaculum sp.]|nr:DUF3127 domain-containing protein [Paramuribaculum sp.]
MAKLTGKVLYIYPTQQLTAKSGNAFSKRDFVLAVQSFDRDTGEPTIDTENTPQLSLTNDRCTQLDNIAVGQIVTVDFYLRGRRYRDESNKEKIITDINVTSVRGISTVPTPTPQTQAAPAHSPTPSPSPQPQPNSKQDDLPF